MGSRTGIVLVLDETLLKETNEGNNKPTLFLKLLLCSTGTAEMAHGYVICVCHLEQIFVISTVLPVLLIIKIIIIIISSSQYPL